MQKRIIPPPASESGHDSKDTWLDLDEHATVQLVSEDPAHPIEAALAQEGGSGGWKAGQPGKQTILIHFKIPQPIRQIYLRFEIPEQRTQEFLLSASTDGGASFREIVRQQFNFSPSTPREEENIHVELSAVNCLKLTLTPDISNENAHATLHELRIR